MEEQRNETQSPQQIETIQIRGISNQDHLLVFYKKIQIEIWFF